MSMSTRSLRGLSIRHLMWAVVVIAFLLTIFIALGRFAIPFVILAAGGAVVAIVTALIKRKQMERASLLWLLAIATEKRMPLAVGLEAFADQWSGGGRQRALSVSTLLNLGLSLPDALDRVPDAVPDSSVILIRVGNETGLLSDSLREAYHYETTRSPMLWVVLEKLIYLGMVLMIMQSISGFVLYFIAPKLEAIFKEFGVEMPWYTAKVFAASQRTMEFIGIQLLALGILGGLAIICAIGELGMMLKGAITGQRQQTIFGWAISRLVFGRAFQSRNTTTILRALALGVDGEQPIGEILNVLASRFPTQPSRKRLTLAAERVNHGADWVEALLLSKLIRQSDAAVLASAQRAGNVGWALRTIASTGERRMVYRLQAIAEILFPIAMLVVGGFVFISAVAYFSPLVALIERLAQ